MDHFGSLWNTNVKMAAELHGFSVNHQLKNHLGEIHLEEECNPQRTDFQNLS